MEIGTNILHAYNCLTGVHQYRHYCVIYCELKATQDHVEFVMAVLQYSHILCCSLHSFDFHLQRGVFLKSVLVCPNSAEGHLYHGLWSFTGSEKWHKS